MSIPHLTQEEATNKWCPFSRYVSANEHDDDGPANRWGKFSNPTPCRCIASSCMAWRWAVPFAPANDPKMKGYCGLAGESGE